jgi:hypothetical protein
MSDQGKANYEAYRTLASRPGVSAAPLPEYEQLPMELAYAFDAGADAVERWLAVAPVDEDAPGNESQPAKVIVVRDEAGREHRYAGPNFGMLHDGTLIIGTRIASGIDGVTGEGIDKLTVAAGHAPGRWSRVHKDGALLDDVRPKAIRLQAALRKIAMADDCTADEIIRGIARVELERSGWDEEDL